ncbi:MAG TPA: M48 family metallopeptidase [Actinomycetota bacterium]|nr:M48 family metallopeptidase [Actinomycetota bacterium]
MYEQIARNKRRTALLVLGALVFAGGLGFLFSYLIVNNGFAGLVIALIIVGIGAAASYFAGDKLVLRAARAKPVTHEEEPRLHNIVEGLALAAGLPKPAVYVVEEKAPNAFATGRDPEHSSIAVTRGLLDTMNRVELEGVIGHEMSHVKDRDILLGTVVAALVGAVVLLSEFMLRWLWWGGGRGGRRDEGAGRAFPLLVILGVVLAILAPFLAQVIKLAVSRRREYLADAEGALLTRYPPGLASALRKIAADTTPLRVANNATAHLWLNQPSRIPGESNHWWENLFSTHPPIRERIRILEEM